MSSGFLLNKLLGDALRNAYHRGDLQVKMLYLVERLPLGKYRVMLKRNFDTACWIPPIGSRGSHSIYYGDRMLQRTIEFFCEQIKAEMPDLPKKEELAEAACNRLLDEAKAAYKKAGRAHHARVAEPELKDIKPTSLDMLNQLVIWLKSNLTDEQWDEFMTLLIDAVETYGRHERSHARETPRNLEATTSDLKDIGVPFTVFNLFEDARIEHISRQELRRVFGWNRFENINKTDNPLNMFHRLIFLEGEPDLEALDSTDTLPHGEEVSQVAESVEAYYKRAIACTTAEMLYPIMVEFVTEFEEYVKALPPPPGSSAGAGTGAGSGSPGATGGDPSGGSEEAESEGGYTSGADLTIAAEAAAKGEDFFEEFEEGTEVVGGTDEEGEAAEAEAKEKLAPSKSRSNAKVDPNKDGGQGIPDSVTPTASGGQATEPAFLAEKAGAMDESFRARIDKVTTMLMRMFRSIELQVPTEAPGRRMSSRHLARNEIRFPRKMLMGGKGKRRYSIVYDCSGSMSGSPDREGKVLLLALNNLARRGYLQGSLVLSGYVNGQPGWLQYDFPVAEDILLRIVPGHCSEGLQAAMADNLKHIKGMDDVFVYTDAAITDEPLDRDFFARNRIWPVGLYVGSEERAGEMDRHFPQNIIRDSIEDVVEAMLTRNRRTVG